MNALYEHKWNKSRAVDAVWATVVGLGSRAPGRLMMALQAYMDESEDGKTYVIAGYIATAEVWAKFVRDWEKLLPAATRDNKGNFNFKMSHMAGRGHWEKVAAFYRIIEKHNLVALSCRLDIATLNRAKARIWVPGLEIDWGYINNPYLMTFRALMDMFHSRRDAFLKVFPKDQKVDFIFDDRGEETVIRNIWNEYMALRPSETRALYGAHPRFEKDEDFLMLQAADFLAWWIRKWTTEGAPEKIERQDFGHWERLKDLPHIAISFSEDQLFSDFRKMLGEQNRAWAHYL